MSCLHPARCRRPSRPCSARSPARQHEALGVWLQLLWFPVGLFGVLLVMTLDGSVVGMPLVLLALPPFTAGRMRRRGGRAPRSLLAAGFVGTAVVATMGAWILIASNQDVGQEQATVDGYDLVMLLTLVGWTLSTTLATALTWRRPSFEPSGRTG